jgi:hypothetical protein
MSLSDPWLDAEQIKVTLQHPKAELTVLIGAAWCDKCQEMKQDFEKASETGHEKHIWLCLDLEEHAEFILPYFPDNLPILLQYQKGQLKTSGIVKPTGDGNWTFLDDQPVNTAELPNFWERFSQDDWT